MAEGERELLEDPGRFTPARARPPRVHARRSAPGRRDARARRHDVRRARRAGPLAGASRLPRRRPPLLGRRPVRGLGRAHRSSRGPTGTRCSSRSARSSTRFRPRPSSTRVTARTTTLGAELARNPFLADLRAERTGVSARANRAAARNARRRSHRPAAVAPRGRRGGAAVRALRLPADPDSGLRGHRALRADVRRGLGRRAEGDVHVRGSRGPVAHPAPGGDRADLPRLRRARDASRPAAREALHHRSDVPVLGTAERARTASTGSSPSRRSARTTRRSTRR